jgi:hypothetical protein
MTNAAKAARAEAPHRFRVCYHEACHALISRLHGLTDGMVVIHEKGGIHWTGDRDLSDAQATDLSDTDSKLERFVDEARKVMPKHGEAHSAEAMYLLVNARKAVLVQLAGHVGERLRFGPTLGGHDRDLRIARTYAEVLVMHPAHVGIYLLSAEHEVACLLHQYRRSVEEIANRLDRDGRIDAAGIDEAIACGVAMDQAVAEQERRVDFAKRILNSNFREANNESFEP